MMGPAHSLSGAAAWLGAGAVAAGLHHPMPWPTLVVGALHLRGCGPRARPRPPSRRRSPAPSARCLARLCEIIDKIAHATYNGDPRQGRPAPRRRPPHPDPHLAVGRLIGAGCSALAVYGGRWVVLAILFVHMVLAVEGLLWRQARTPADVLVWLLGATSAWVAGRCAGRPGQRQGLAVHPARPALPVDRHAHRARRAGALRRRRAHGLRLPDPVADTDRPQALVSDRPAEVHALPGRQLGGDQGAHPGLHSLVRRRPCALGALGVFS